MSSQEAGCFQSSWVKSWGWIIYFKKGFDQRRVWVYDRFAGKPRLCIWLQMQEFLKLCGYILASAIIYLTMKPKLFCIFILMVPNIIIFNSILF
jgi:hypothetical protein